MIVFNMKENRETLKTKKKFYKDKMITEGENYLMYKYYHLGEPTDFKKLSHLKNLHRAYSSDNCEVQNFLKKQIKPKHKYTKIKNETRCEEFDICYNN